MRILMIEDDRDLCGAVDIHLKSQGYTVDYAHDGGVRFALIFSAFHVIAFFFRFSYLIFATTTIFFTTFFFVFCF